MEELNFLTETEIRKAGEKYVTPFFVYDETSIRRQAQILLQFPDAYGKTIRYAMKANPNGNILKILEGEGLSIDASSSYEVKRALVMGIQAENILLTAQELAHNLKEIVDQGVEFNATSLHQLETYGRIFKGRNVSVRFNPGTGSGGTKRTNVGGHSSSFGIWKEDINKVKMILKKYHLKLIRVHTHIGSGSDPVVWQKVAKISLNIVQQFPSVKILNLGGGFKISRMKDETTTDVIKIGKPVKELFEQFAQREGRKLKLELEPGTFLVANSGVLVSQIQDVNFTGEKGYHFIKINGGMTEILRPSMYGAQHPLFTVSQSENESSDETESYIVNGHCCESGDILTPKDGDPEGLKPRTLKKIKIGDYLIIGGAGAYCSSMATKNYNSFPECSEFMRNEKKEWRLIRKRQLPEQIWQNEILPE